MNNYQRHHHQEWRKFFWSYLGGLRNPFTSIAAVQVKASNWVSDPEILRDRTWSHLWLNCVPTQQPPQYLCVWHCGGDENVQALAPVLCRRSWWELYLSPPTIEFYKKTCLICVPQNQSPPLTEFYNNLYWSPEVEAEASEIFPGPKLGGPHIIQQWKWGQ